MPYHFTNLPFKFMLIYRASCDGFGIENFHKNYDNKGPTVVVIKVRNSGEIIGGYNPLERTSKSFIFSLTNKVFPILSQVSSKEEAIICNYEKKVISRETFEIEEYEVFQIIDERFSQYINR
ncbi:hypothetical protein C2G38_2159257 [Gigaspora rosea]|uniref:TLDc domain-containing protein n=1 Tax=Gigaspora rosea TaxID=44941 RepID=A0A397W2Z1_9GLOM|nr:hypothetical protein C2G38_2159257 [Gigaspora rosea]